MKGYYLENILTVAKVKVFIMQNGRFQNNVLELLMCKNHFSVLAGKRQ